MLPLSRFSAYSTAGLVVLTKVNCTSSVIKVYRKKIKNKIRPCNQLSNKCVNLRLFCYKFILCTLPIFHELVLNMTDMKTISRVPQWWRVITIWRTIWKAFNWYPLLNFKCKEDFFALEGFLKSLKTHTENINQSFLLFFPYHDDWNTWLYRRHPTIVFCKISVWRSKNCLEFSRAWRWREESENARFRKTTDCI